ncbi:hypothetical protein M8J76_011310 [Diaphorina citri]|nr:hypothetical protein M8J76_011310 [Diaphorina citri]
MLLNINYCCVYLIYTCVYSCFLCLLTVTNFFFSYSPLLFDTTVNYTHVKFDYIVVGGGTGGSVLIHELLQHNALNQTILLLEAGPRSYSLLDIPMLAPLLQRTRYDWQFETERQTHACWGLDNQASKWPRGKILGGSSRLNYMVYLRGHQNDFDSLWPASWKFTDFEKYSSISYTIMKPFSLLSTYLLPEDPIDLNQGNHTGFMNTPLTVTKGLRSCCDHYIDRSNNLLTVLTDAMVTKLLFEGTTAVGVEYEVNTVKYRASGNTIPEIVDSRHVGHNLQDHIGVGVDNILINTTLISSYDVINPKHFWDFHVKKEGLWTFSGVEVVALLKTDEALPVPDIQLMILPAGINIDAGTGFRHTMGFSEEVWDSYFQLPSEGSTITMLIVLLHPQSRGVVSLRNSSPYSKPKIDPHYLSDPRDVDTLVKGIRLVQSLLESNPGLRAMNATLRVTPLPGCESHTLGSHSYWECYVRTLTLTSYHPVGTCAMGSVVDSTLKVKGVHNLYIGDASVIPSLPSANTQALTILVAQKLARHLQYLTYVRHKSCPRQFIWTAQCCLLDGNLN